MLNCVTPAASSARNFFLMRLGRADQAEPFDHFVGNEFRVVAANLAVMLIVVARRDPARTMSAPEEDLRACTAGSDPSRDSTPEPETSARVRARRSRSSDTQTGAADITSIALRIAPRSSRAFFYETHAPLNQRRIGKLQNDSVGHAPGHVQHLGAVACDPHSRRILRPAEYASAARRAELLSRR